MARSKSPKQGDVYWIDPNPASDREKKNGHRFVIITPQKINFLGVSMAVPIATAGALTLNMGLTVPVVTHDTRGLAVCNQVRSFDVQARVQAGMACFIETLDEALVSEIVNRVLSVIEPAAEN